MGYSNNVRESASCVCVCITRYGNLVGYNEKLLWNYGKIRTRIDLQLSSPFNANNGEGDGGGEHAQQLYKLGRRTEPMGPDPLAQHKIRVTEGHTEHAQDNVGHWACE